MGGARRLPLAPGLLGWPRRGGQRRAARRHDCADRALRDFEPDGDLRPPPRRYRAAVLHLPHAGVRRSDGPQSGEPLRAASQPRHVLEMAGRQHHRPHAAPGRPLHRRRAVRRACGKGQHRPPDGTEGPAHQHGRLDVRGRSARRLRTPAAPALSGPDAAVQPRAVARDDGEPGGLRQPGPRPEPGGHRSLAVRPRALDPRGSPALRAEAGPLRPDLPRRARDRRPRTPRPAGPPERAHLGTDRPGHRRTDRGRAGARPGVRRHLPRQPVVRVDDPGPGRRPGPGDGRPAGAAGPRLRRGPPGDRRRRLLRIRPPHVPAHAPGQSRTRPGARVVLLLRSGSRPRAARRGRDRHLLVHGAGDGRQRSPVRGRAGVPAARRHRHAHQAHRARKRGGARPNTRLPGEHHRLPELRSGQPPPGHLVRHGRVQPLRLRGPAARTAGG